MGGFRMKRIIRLPNGHRCGLGEYARSWREVKRLAATAPDAQIKDWDHFPTSAATVLHDLRFGMHDRINRHIAGYDRGRKWAIEWQVETIRTARALNTPRLAIHWLPTEWRGRFSHRLSR